VLEIWDVALANAGVVATATRRLIRCRVRPRSFWTSRAEVARSHGGKLRALGSLTADATEPGDSYRLKGRDLGRIPAATASSWLLNPSR
jgi:hypothetical protein